MQWSASFLESFANTWGSPRESVPIFSFAGSAALARSAVLQYRYTSTPTTFSRRFATHVGTPEGQLRTPLSSLANSLAGALILHGHARDPVAAHISCPCRPEYCPRLVSRDTDAGRQHPRSAHRRHVLSTRPAGLLGRSQSGQHDCDRVAR